MKVKLKETRDKSVEDLRREITEKQRHLFDLRSQAVTEKLEDPTQLGKTKREIARILTILREREIQTNPPAPEKPKAPKRREKRAAKKVARRATLRIRAPKKRDRKEAAGAAAAETK